MSGRCARRVFGSGAASRRGGLAEAGPWLVAGGETGPVRQRAEEGGTILRQRLVSDSLLLGGLVLAGPDLGPADERRCAVLARLTADALSGLHQRRLSQLVLESLEQSEEAVSFYDEEEGIVFTNDAYHRIFPHYPDRRALRGAHHLDLYRLDLDAGIIDDPLARADPETYLAERARKSRLLTDRQREIQRVGGRTYIYTRTRSRTGATLSRRTDITEQALTEARLREREAELRTLAFQDSLTGLFNRAYLREKVEQLERALAEGRVAGLCVLMIDLNGFKAVNDTYGHDCGDRVLRIVGARLSGILPPEAVLMRLGGDEFLVLLEQAAEEPELAAMAEAIIAAVTEPIRDGDLALSVGASIGIAAVRGPQTEIDAIIGRADLAMYEAKSLRCSGYRFFHSGLREQRLAQLALIEDVRGALRRGEFALHYQPQFRTQDGGLAGFEALARWTHPRHGPIPPSTFIPIMEENGLIEALGTWILDTACAEARTWPTDLRLAVNVSPLQVRSGRFSLTLAEALLRSGLPPHRLELEITESVLLADEARSRAELERWKALGARIALDDFGRGYSGLGYLTAFPIDKIKIDRAFLAGFDAQRPDAAAGVILHAIIRLGRVLGKTVTVEGVESPDQLAHLRRERCTEVQGFLLGRPMPAAEVPGFIAQRAAPSAA
ncbi:MULTISPECIES: putative bifunctional diguanylate cyclase/phosphodiesterase [unclassified Methylobacterium]|uniref:putative bifunctional diguanylate cyclase/phosphodiesterase n=1 Tax=unclassified Methylobacterium TaxID=2615210 RepID=UPI001F431450|nr:MULTISPECIES: GGDEF and EAL domain-containing protein [Methylobacterium]WFT80384.1 GGDEF and EAL domain-containing protein [Methylobacterium nodulans]